jgi:hypothetical protein
MGMSRADSLISKDKLSAVRCPSWFAFEGGVVGREYQLAMRPRAPRRLD